MIDVESLLNVVNAIKKIMKKKICFLIWPILQSILKKSIILNYFYAHFIIKFLLWNAMHFDFVMEFLMFFRF